MAATTTTTWAEIDAGTWLHNPATGEIGHVQVSPAGTDGRRLEADLWLQPGAAVVGAHVHDALVERFEVIVGEVGFEVGGARRAARAGDAPIEAPAGSAHDWWNAGDGVARVRVTVEAIAGAAGRPASRFVELIEALFSLGALGRVNQKGLPDPLWLAAIAREYRDVARFVRPPAVVQPILFGPLAALARRTGRDPRRAELHGPSAPCVIDAPGESELAGLLARGVGARAARGH
ncbi:MAG: cupin domain-containing protein [Thermoleophilia bacterium]